MQGGERGNRVAVACVMALLSLLLNSAHQVASSAGTGGRSPGAVPLHRRLVQLPPHPAGPRLAQPDENETDNYIQLAAQPESSTIQSDPPGTR